MWEDSQAVEDSPAPAVDDGYANDGEDGACSDDCQVIGSKEAAAAPSAAAPSTAALAFTSPQQERNRQQLSQLLEAVKAKMKASENTDCGILGWKVAEFCFVKFWGHVLVLLVLVSAVGVWHHNPQQLFDSPSFDRGIRLGARATTLTSSRT